MQDQLQGGGIGHLASVNDFENQALMRESLKATCNNSGCWYMSNLDASTSDEQDLDLELKRLEVLKSYDVLDMDTDSSFERVTGLAARIFSVPVCLVSIVDLGRQWFASNRGLGETKETERKVAFCAHAILSTLDMLIVPDATKDSRFRENPLVTGGPLIRFYAGVPLVTPEGFKLGTVCIIDNKPWPNGLNLSQKQNLLEMASMVMDTLVMRKKDREMMERSRGRIIACTAHEMLTPLTSIQLNLGMMNDDTDLKSHMSEANKELLNSTIDCVGLMTNICNQTIESFRSSSKTIDMYTNHSSELEEVVISEIVAKIKHIISPYRKKIPLTIHVDNEMPKVILSNSLKLFRAMLSMLINSIESAKSGSVIVNISVEHLGEDSKNLQKRDIILFQCSKSVDGNFDESRENLRMFSASSHVKALGGEFGYRPRTITQEQSQRNEGKEMQWFTIPIVLPEKTKFDEVFVNGKGKDEDSEMTSKDEVRRSEKRSKSETQEFPQRRKDFFKKPRISQSNKKDDCASEDDYELPTSFPQMSICSKRKKCALIIDDTKIIRKVFVRALTGMGFAVKQAENGLKGLLEMKTVMFDVVFCDFLMPLLDGLDCVQQYREWEKDNRPCFKQFIVGISAHADSNDAERGLKVGMNKFMAKPILLKQLKEVIFGEEVTNTTKNVNALAARVDIRPFCLFENDVEVTDDERSLCTSSDAENSQRHYTCLVAEGLSEVILTIVRCVERKNWRVRVVRNGVDALRWMKMRNWDAIFIDDNLPQLSGHTCVSIFRKWESENRVARQRNINMISAVYNCENKRVPPECDGALGTHFSQDDIVRVLDSGAKYQKKPSLL